MEATDGKKTEDNSDEKTSHIESLNNSSTLAEELNNENMSDAIVEILHKGSKYQLLFNETFLLVDKYDQTNIVIYPDKKNIPSVTWTFVFKFLDNFVVSSSSYNVVILDKTVTFNFTNWYSDNWVENPEPEPINAEGAGIHLLVKVKSMCNRSQNMRTLFVSIWKKM